MLYRCLFVCLSVHSESYERILMKFLEGWGVAHGTIDHILVEIRIMIRTQEFKKSLFILVFPTDRQE